MKAVLLAAGASTRTYPLTITKPKPLLPLLNKTIIEYTLNNLRNLRNIDEVIIVIGYKKEMIKSHLGDYYHGMKLTYVVQEKPLGTGHAISMAKDCFNKSDKSFLIMNGDDIFAIDDLAHCLEEVNSIMVTEVDNPQNFGVFESKEINEKEYARNLIEKPQNPKSNLANIGVYHFNTDFLSYVDKIKPSKRGEYEITDAIRRYMDWNDIRLIKAKQWLAIGYPWDLLSANEELMKNKQESIIKENINMKKESQIRGKCIVGNNVSIGSKSIIENSIIMDNVKIGANCHIKDSIIGQDCVISDNFETINQDYEITSIIKDKKIHVNRKTLGIIVGDNADISKDITSYPGIKVWPNTKVYNVKSLKTDWKE